MGAVCPVSMSLGSLEAASLYAFVVWSLLSPLRYMSSESNFREVETQKCWRREIGGAKKKYFKTQQNLVLGFSIAKDSVTQCVLSRKDVSLHPPFVLWPRHSFRDLSSTRASSRVLKKLEQEATKRKTHRVLHD